MKRLIIWCKVLYWHLTSMKCNKKAILLTVDQTIDEVLENGKSLIRLGDGELNILEGGNVHYQKYDKNLQIEMRKLLDYYISNNGKCEYLLCMPNEFLKCNGISLSRKRVWIASWARFRYYFKRKYDIKIQYGDAFMFSKAYSDKYERIWKDKKNIIFIHNSKIYADEFAKNYKKNVIFIEIPSENSYSKIDNIVQQIKDKINELDKLEESVVLISAGPCSKVLIYRLKDEKIQLIDTGHCWDDPLAIM